MPARMAVQVIVVLCKHRYPSPLAPGIRSIVESLVAKRDQRKDGFVRVIKKAMQTRIGNDA